MESLQLTREGILYSVATGSGGIIESSSMAVDGVDGLTIISEKRDIELKFGDWYQDEHGRYVSGAQLSSDIHGWIRTLRKQS